MFNGALDLLKVKHSTIAAVMFFVFSSPPMYRFTNQLLQLVFTAAETSVGGCPNSFGLVLHTMVFAAATYGMMMLPTHDERF